MEHTNALLPPTQYYEERSVIHTMSRKLREFVYLDQASLSNHLSSLGEGIPQEIIQQSGDETETSGQGKIGLSSLGLGASGKHSRLSSDNVETTLQATAPYHFQHLLNLLEDEEITVHHKLEPGLERGDIVEVTDELSAMSLFQFELLLDAFLSMMNQEVHESFDELNEGDISEDVSLEEIEQIEELQYIIQQFSGGNIPLRTLSTEQPAGMLLDPQNVRGNPQRIFLEKRRYTVFGKIEEVLSEDETWDPATVTQILDRYVPQERAGPELRRDLKNVSRELNMNLTDEDMVIEGPAVIVHPIAVYW
jgi:hypothetical protein